MTKTRKKMPAKPALLEIPAPDVTSPATLGETAVDTEVESTPTAEQFSAAVTETAELMLSNCSEVRVRTSWFSTSVKMDTKNATKMLEAIGADRKAISISKRLMSSKHEAMQAVKDAKAAIDSHVSAWTIPMMTLRVATSTTDDDTAKKDAGVRLIQKKDMTQFDERLHYLIGLLKTAAQKLQEAMPDIKAEDRVRLKDSFDETDYPEDVAGAISVDVNYRTVGVDIDWKTLCPEIYERTRLEAKQRFDSVVENAATEFADRFIKYVKQVTDQIGNRVRLSPVAGHNRMAITNADGTPGVVDVNEAEVLAKLTHADEPDEIPDGKILVQLRLQKSGIGRSVDVWLAEPITLAMYNGNLRPYESDTERRKLYESTIENLRGEMENFLKIGQMLGPYEGIIGDAVTKVQQLLGSASRDMKVSEIAAEIRDSRTFRERMKECLVGVTTSVESVMKEAKVLRRSVRRLDLTKL